MKIAICFSGQLRTGLEASDNIKRYLGILYPFCDVFIHTWDVDTQKYYNNTILNKEKISVDKFRKITEIYNPKKIIVDDFYKTREIENQVNNDYNLFGRISPLWYSFMKSVQFKQEYEEEQRFEYDYVLKIRFDLIFSPIRRLSYELESLFLKNNEFYVENWSSERISEFLDDVYFISNSRNMNMASNYYNEEKLHNNYSFRKHLKLQSLKFPNIDNMANFYRGQYGYGIYRKECLDISPLNNYVECRECEKRHDINPLIEKKII